MHAGGNWAVRSRLEPMIEVARILKRRFENIITYLRHRITNASSESINAKIQWVKYTARGFLSFELDDQIFVERARMADSESM